MKTIQKGFTLIELMIVVAIIAILAAIALPAYQDYTIRSQVSEASSLVAGAKTSVTEFKADRGAWPADNSAAGMSTDTDIKGKYVSAVTVSDGLITATLNGPNVNKAIAGKTLAFSPVSNIGSIDWVCKGKGDVDNKYRPAVCR